MSASRSGRKEGCVAIRLERLNAQTPWVFGILAAPMAVVQYGLVQGSLSLLLRQQGTDLALAARTISLLLLTQSIYFLWSPIADLWLRRRTWLMLGAAGAATSLIGAFHLRNLSSSLGIAALFLAACCSQIVVAACGGLMGSLGTEEARRRASSFYQAGSLACGAASVFIIATLAGHLQHTTLGWLIGAMVALPALRACTVPEQRSERCTSMREVLARVAGEFRRTFLRRRAIPYIVVILSPTGTGAAMSLLAGLAVDYQVEAHQVAWINGLAGALLTSAGSLVATLIPPRVSAPLGFVSACLVNEATLAVLWFGPLSPWTYFLGTTLFLFTLGTCYAMFTAVILELLGDSGKSGGSRFAIINSLGNIPVAYMVSVDGLGYARWGIRGMPATDALLGFVSGAALLSYFLLHGHRAPDHRRSSSSAA